MKRSKITKASMSLIETTRELCPLRVCVCVLRIKTLKVGCPFAADTKRPASGALHIRTQLGVGGRKRVARPVCRAVWILAKATRGLGSERG